MLTKDKYAMNDSERSASSDQFVEVRPPNLILRIIWFLLVGWWLAAILSVAAWALNATVIGLPLGLWIINRLPLAATLRLSNSRYSVENGVLQRGIEQRP